MYGHTLGTPCLRRFRDTRRLPNNGPIFLFPAFGLFARNSRYYLERPALLKLVGALERYELDFCESGAAGGDRHFGGFWRMRSAKGLEAYMNADPDREVIVFTEAIRVPIRERAAFLERVCAGDENLRLKVEALLRAHDRLGDFLEEPPTGRPPGETD